MRRGVWICLLMVAALVGGGCQLRVGQRLDSASRLMESRPDSALTLLEGINGRRLWGEDEALYALLMTRAIDRNFRDETNDSLISIAVNFYDFTDDLPHQMMAHHYRAVIRYNAGLYESALYDAFQAHELALQLNDAVFLSRIETVIGLIYGLSESYVSSYEWHLRSLHHAKQTNHPEWLPGLYKLVGEELYNIHRFKESFAYFDSATVNSSTPDIDILEMRYISNVFLENYSTADSILFEIQNEGFDLPRRVVLVNAELHPESSLETLDSLKLVIESADDRLDMNYAYILAYLSQGDIDSAVVALHRHIFKYNQLVSSASNKRLIDVERRYNEEVAEELSRKNRSYRSGLIISILTLALVLIIGTFVIVYSRNRQRRKLLEWERNMLLLQNEYSLIKSKLNVSETKLSETKCYVNSLETELYGLYADKNTIKKQNEIIDSLNLRINELQKENEQGILNQHQQIESLNVEITRLRQVSYQVFLNQFSWIERFSSLYNKVSGAPDKEKALIDSFSKHINKLFSERNFIESLPELISQYDPTLMSDIDSFHLIASEREVLLCFICGFNPSIISILINKSQRAIYNLKARIKEKLLATQSPSAVRIVDMIYK